MISRDQSESREMGLIKDRWARTRRMIGADPSSISERSDLERG